MSASKEREGSKNKGSTSVDGYSDEVILSKTPTDSTQKKVVCPVLAHRRNKQPVVPSIPHMAVPLLCTTIAIHLLNSVVEVLVVLEVALATSESFT